jgi:3-oxoacyl-(acyl-carrier-protein) synthase
LREITSSCHSLLPVGTPKVLRHDDHEEPIVITGIGMIASVGRTRESVWQAVREGRSGARRLEGLPGIPDGLLIGAPVMMESEIAGQLKVIALAEHAAAEALNDAQIEWRHIDADRFACAISGHMGDTGYVAENMGVADRFPVSTVPWWEQWLPNTACTTVATRYGLYGPRLCHSTACASGMIDILGAVRAIQDDQCDIALAGSAEGFHPLFAAGFHNMRVLAYDDDPKRACRPFDSTRSGFIMGEGAAMFVIERLSHALERNARIYAEIVAGKTVADAHHVTGIDLTSESLAYLISETLHAAKLEPHEIGYINAHGTGTQQNDLAESRGIRRAMGVAADGLCVSSTKSALGHLVNAAGSVELAITTLAMRDGFVPPTLNLTHPDPECDLDCIPMVGRNAELVCAMKLSVAFGGHLAAVILRRWNDVNTGFGYPHLRVA